VVSYVFYASIRPDRPIFLPDASFLVAAIIACSPSQSS
jgi:hypothetical protein